MDQEEKALKRSNSRQASASQKGFCIWFTGLSGSGKSTTANHLKSKLEQYNRYVTLLDGDVVRTHLSNGLGFSREDRDINILRIGFVAAEIVRHGGIVICAAISPYRIARQKARDMVGKPHFVEVFMDTPLDLCEKRDVKGLYARARRGEIKEFTGVDDPYEPPLHPEISLDTQDSTVDENSSRILVYLQNAGLLYRG
jgi:sulfate adenylyltransferase